MTSSIQTFAPVVGLLIETNPSRVVDIGPGWGTYGLACREHLPHLEALHAVENRAHRRPTIEPIYDWVYHGDPCDDAYNTRFWARWDTALLVDVLDKLTIEDSQRLTERLHEANLRIVLSTSDISPWRTATNTGYRIEADASTSNTSAYLLVP